MYIARILYPVKVLGPGKRIGIWFDGCKHNCKGCSNPELHEFKEEYKVSLETIVQMISKVVITHPVDGFTITGGDPFEQPDALEQLVDYLSTVSKDILVYTGYEYKELIETNKSILDKIAVLIDGKYVEKQNVGEVLRGSSNQNIIILNSDFEDLYQSYISSTESEIQNFYINNSVISVGIHKPGYEVAIDEVLTRKGLINNG